ncbi:hypothetical protein GCM10010211_16990 [Streptomyces albospinus]|uniref:ATP-binding protein n=1 Tax=Streptomyces albospinus TaxID=285515 RepID=A0ABQ2UW21_9ACTN|nr:hypothetical protein [Streptomyces albospinus]GGU52990.1 hypothetical protein GCM10010211_16990 [Streptomyces albospinus]
MRRVLTAVGMAAAAMTLGSAAGAQAADLPKVPDMGGLTNVDADGVGGAVGGVGQTATKLAGDTGDKTVHKAVPAASKASGAAVEKVTPAATQTAGSVASSASELVGETAKMAGEGGLIGGLPAKGLPTTEALPTAKGLPTTGALPTAKGLPTTEVLSTAKGLPTTEALPTAKGLPTTGALPTAKGLPTQGLPSTDQLPLKGLSGLS